MSSNTTRSDYGSASFLSSVNSSERLSLSASSYRRRHSSESSRNRMERGLGFHRLNSSGYESFGEPDSPTKAPEEALYPQNAKDDPRYPPPKYSDIFPVELVRLPSENPTSSDCEYEREIRPRESRRRHRSDGSHRVRSTLIKVPEEATEMVFRGRDESSNAPDLTFEDGEDLLGGPLQVDVCGKITEYELVPLASKDEARRRLEKYSKKHFLCRNEVAKKCQICSTEGMVAFRYTLRTMTESREVIKKTKIYRGGEVDRPRPGAVIAVWDYEIDQPFEMCKEHSAYYPLPRTETIEDCKHCRGTSNVTCSSCSGTGSRQCYRCHGSGYEESYRRSSRTCHQCNGGHETCPQCGGRRETPCGYCEARGRVVAYKELKVTWKLHYRVYVDEVDDVPDKLLKSRGGINILSKKGPKLNPIREGELLHDSIRRYSEMVLKEKWQGEKSLLQEHTVEMVPVQAVSCKYKEKVFRFYLVGVDRKVHAPSYPNKRFSSITKLFSKN